MPNDQVRINDKYAQRKAAGGRPRVLLPSQAGW
jgi:hypothetical protein